MQKKSFTLVELMIVIAIIAIIAGVAIPSFQRSRLNANESGAIETLRTVNTAFGSFYAGNGRYPANFTELTAVTPAYLNYQLQSGTNDVFQRHGYNIDMDVPNSSDDIYIVEAIPQEFGVTGNHWYRITETGVIEIKYSATGTYQPYE